MTDESARSRHLDAALVANPEELTFRAIRSLLDTWPAGADRDRAVQRAVQQLASWPDEARQVRIDLDHPDETLKAPSWPLVRTLKVALDPVSPEREQVIVGRLEEVARWPDLAEITSLVVEGDYWGRSIDPASIAILGRSPYLRRLTALSLDGVDATAGLVQSLVDGDFLSQLRTFSAHDAGDIDVEPDVPHWAPLLRSGRCAGLEELEIQYPTAADLRALREATLPHLRKLSLSYIHPESLAELFADRDFAGRLRSLRVIPDREPDRLAAVLAASPHLEGLEELDLSGTATGPMAVAALARAPFLANLRSLDLGECPLGDAGWGHLAQLHLPKLRKLGLYDTEAADTGLAALCGSAGLPALDDLNLSQNCFSVRSGAVLARAPWLAGLLALRLQSDEPGLRDGVAELVARLGQLRVLDIDGTGAGPASARALARRAGALEDLNLAYCEVGADGLEALLAGLAPGRLVHLGMALCAVGDAGAEALARAEGLARLRSLNLLGNDLTARGFAAVASAPWVEGLWSLSLYGNTAAGPEGARALARSGQLRGLIDLDTDNCNFDEASTRELAGSPIVARLDRLVINPYMPHSAPWGTSPQLRPGLLRSIRHQLVDGAAKRQ